MKLSSDFAILDVKEGREELAQHFKSRPPLGTCPEHLRIPVTIKGYIDAQSGSDDGTSIEFSVQVRVLTYNIPGVPLPIDEGIEDYFDGVVGVVEATSFEYSCLYKDFWVERGYGYGPCIGFHGDRPVHLSLRTATIDGHRILFIEPTSTIVDHDLVRAWLRRHLPPTAFKGEHLNMVDAQNFYNVFPRP